MRTQARALAYAGVEAYAVADYRTAYEKLEESFRLLPVPSLGLWSARALVKLGRLVEAERRYRAVSDMVVSPTDPPVQASAQVDAARELQELVERVPSLVFRFSGTRPAQTKVEVDGVPVAGGDLDRPYRVDPGRHVVVCTAGAEKTVVLMDLTESQREEVWFRFAEAAPAVPAPVVEPVTRAVPVDRTATALRTAGWVGVAAGGLGVATGLVAYLAGRDPHSEIRAFGECSGASCPPGATAAYQAYETWRTLEIVGLLSGGLLGAAGVTLLIASHGSHAGAESVDAGQLGLRLGPAQASLFGSF